MEKALGVAGRETPQPEYFHQGKTGEQHVEAAHSGYGDSGAIDGMQFRDKSGVRVERDKIHAVLKEKLENVSSPRTGPNVELPESGKLQ